MTTRFVFSIGALVRTTQKYTPACEINLGSLLNNVPTRRVSIQHFLTIPASHSQNGVQVHVQGYQAIKVVHSGIVPDIIVDLRSDTVTLPSQGMREAIANAVVGDDVFEEDPTTKEFESRIAKLLDKEAALFVTSGTQGNLISSLVHCNVRGSEMICGDNSHMYKYEQGNVAQFGGIHSCQLPNELDGTFSIDALKSHIRTNDIHYPITKLVCVENTHNRCGGRVLPIKWLDELAEVCKQHDIPIHMDGARLFNAAAASGIPTSRIVRDMSSVSVCLSKGLEAPAGSVIAGSKTFIEQARRMRKALGGGMRQNGILAAAGLYILDNMISRLQEDHDNAQLIANIVNSKVGKLARIDTDRLETNILVLHVTNGCDITDFCARLEAVENNEIAVLGKGISLKCFPWANTSARLVTHFNISTEMAELAAQKICFVAQETSRVKATS